jgi:hypothetical protein
MPVLALDKVAGKRVDMTFLMDVQLRGLGSPGESIVVRSLLSSVAIRVGRSGYLEDM